MSKDGHAVTIGVYDRALISKSNANLFMRFTAKVISRGGEFSYAWAKHGFPGS